MLLGMINKMGFPEHLKVEIRKKSHFSCCLCKNIGIEIHHIVPQEEGGSDEDENAAPLCPSCHEIYGANPQKRKFIREARDFWFDICKKRYSSDSDKLDEIKNVVQNTVKYEDLEKFKKDLFEHIQQNTALPRDEKVIINAMDMYCDMIWYNRHQYLKHKIENGEETVEPSILDGALKAAIKVEKKYGIMDWRVAMQIALEIAKEEFCKFGVF